MTINLLNNPLFAYTVAGGLIIAIGYIFLKKRKPSTENFIPQRFEKTVFDEIKNKINNQGIKIKGGKLRVGFNTIASIDSWINIKGNFSKMVYDPSSRRYIPSSKKEVEKYNFIILRAKNKNMFLKLFGVKKYYFILKENSIQSFDDKTSTWILCNGHNLDTYGNIWINSSQAMEFINDISLKRTFENSMTHIENFPDRVIHIEMQQAKRNQIIRAEAEALRYRYEGTKRMDETYTQ